MMAGNQKSPTLKLLIYMSLKGIAMRHAFVAKVQADDTYRRASSSP